MKGRHLRRRFSLQPSFMKDDCEDSKHRRDKVHRHDTEDSIATSNVRHKIVVMGAAKVGKSSLINQFLYNKYTPKYKRTVEEMHQGNFSVAGVGLTLDILDTSGANEFPAMRALSIQSADAFILVYDVTDANTFCELKLLRDQIHETKGTSSVAMVVVGNKTDLLIEDSDRREMNRENTENVVTMDWENGYVECSAKDNENVTEIFKELLVQAKITYNLSPALRRRRRQSLPPQQSGASSSGGPPGTPQSLPPSTSHVPSPQQLQHLQQIQERSIGGKRNSCILS
ncbi:ras-related protein Rap-1b [Lutzomyia longipalpis]|uniref:ras-related protein Rap-1b n=1 Tax=Lutzomyia longipalpis TaxID=7200 RepID=UPI002483E213|nr:ras-related protein Rap-1b [Lutzomyia longipalpis]XP_055693417.1 ras-related protein Rap-1b [Lutzomyia longipalpis]XP_055693418.1 ras-related protein Rap-1b [Lutzomyia longipalpis]XP_055693419.1 ras-related protein Rap-1b [Lutzomyia longipalpis]XP_055693420.1 ras-related protein Rap-1b [Lutzomyia longipalpis]